MKKELSQNVRLGVFVIVGVILLITGLYFMGKRQSLFGAQMTIKARFKNVSGLMQGNNVRYGGIDIGTVDKIEIENDSSVIVVMNIEENAKKYIKKNSLATIGTDGLMGNKLVNINSVPGASSDITEGDILKTHPPVETDEMLQTLNVTEENIKVISENLLQITEKINTKNSLWTLLADTSLAGTVKSSFVNIQSASKNSLLLTGNLHDLSEKFKNNKGGLAALITDTTINGKVNQIIVKINSISDSAIHISGNLSNISKQMRNSKTTVGFLLNDTSFVPNLNSTVKNLNKGSQLLNEDLEGLKHSILLRKYFKKLDKEKKTEVVKGWEKK